MIHVDFYIVLSGIFIRFYRFKNEVAQHLDDIWFLDYLVSMELPLIKCFGDEQCRKIVLQNCKQLFESAIQRRKLKNR